MSCETWQTLLLISGVVAQLWAAGRLLRGARQDRVGQEGIETEDEADPRRTRIQRRLGIAYDIGGRTPTVDERLAQVEAELRELRQALTTVENEMRAEIERQMGWTGRQVVRDRERSAARLRAARSDRLWGAGLGLLGAALLLAGGLATCA